MAQFPIRIPKVSLATTEATLVERLIDEGHTVQEGEPLFLIETEKVETEIDAPASGVVHWSTDAGETLDVGAQIGHIELAE